MKHSYKYLIIIVLWMCSCATPVPPSGGPKDTEPPIVKEVVPANGSVNFEFEKIVFEFNEYIQFNSATGSVIISPPLEPEPEYRVKGKKLILTFKQLPIPNTTYTFNFGESIKDNNEANIASGLTYVFSTGAYLDSLQLTGNVVDAFDLQPVENVQVMLYQENSDSILTKIRPFYVVKADNSGRFTFNNLKQGNYQLAALQDNNINYLLDQSSEAHAFYTEIIRLDSTLQVANKLLLFTEVTNPKIQKATLVSPGHVRLVFNQAIKQINFDASNFMEGDIAYFNTTNDTLHYWYQTHNQYDTIYTVLNESIADTAQLSLVEPPVNNFQLMVKETAVPSNKPITLASNIPLQSVNPENILLTDSLKNAISFTANVRDFRFIDIEGKFKENTTLYLTVLAGAATDYLGNQNDSLSADFEIVAETSLSNLIINFSEYNSNVIAQLLKSNNQLIEQQFITPNKQITFNDKPPGKYVVRVYEDANQNGEWDTGDFGERRQPERTIFYSTDVELKANWDKEVQVTF